jgi:glycosyltransferase involved in cell wall biosynthesis
MIAAPQVTVILTVFKRVDYLEAALLSVQRQTFTSFELIVTDDAHTEAARKVCAGFGDPRLRYRANLRTLGVAHNIVAALAEARGKYVCILNDDDVLEPEMLESLATPLESNPAMTLAFGNYVMIDASGEEMPDATEHLMRRRLRKELPGGPVSYPLDFAVRGGVMVVMGALIRRTSLDPLWFVPEAGGAYDYWLAVKLAQTGGGFFFVPRSVMRYRVHEDSETARASAEKYSGEVYIYDYLFGADLPQELHRHVRLRLAEFLYLLGNGRLLFGGHAEGARLALQRSLRVRLAPRALIGWVVTWLPSKLRFRILQTWYRMRSPATVSLMSASISVAAKTSPHTPSGGNGSSPESGCAPL